MVRPYAIAALLVALGQGSCLPDSCAGGGCKLSTESMVGTIVEGRDFETFTREACSTCGHSNIRVTWVLDRPAGGDGGIMVQVLFSCGLAPYQPYFFSPTSSIRTIRPGEGGEPTDRGSTSFTDVNVKNVCGENAPVTYQVVVRNALEPDVDGRRAPHMTVDVHLTCPEYDGDGGSPTSPSAGRRDPDVPVHSADRGWATAALAL